MRKFSKQPYVVHLDAVVRILQSFGITAGPVLGAAYLHDTVEDTEASIEDILNAFGEEIAELVYWLTDAEQGKRKIRKVMSAWRLGRAPLDAKLINSPTLSTTRTTSAGTTATLLRFICEKRRRFLP